MAGNRDDWDGVSRLAVPGAAVVPDDPTVALPPTMQRMVPPPFLAYGPGGAVPLIGGDVPAGNGNLVLDGSARQSVSGPPTAGGQPAGMPPALPLTPAIPPAEPMKAGGAGPLPPGRRLPPTVPTIIDGLDRLLARGYDAGMRDHARVPIANAAAPPAGAPLPVPSRRAGPGETMTVAPDPDESGRVASLYTPSAIEVMPGDEIRRGNQGMDLDDAARERAYVQFWRDAVNTPGASGDHPSREELEARLRAYVGEYIPRHTADVSTPMWRFIQHAWATHQQINWGLVTRRLHRLSTEPGPGGISEQERQANRNDFATSPGGTAAINYLDPFRLPKYLRYLPGRLGQMGENYAEGRDAVDRAHPIAAEIGSLAKLAVLPMPEAVPEQMLAGSGYGFGDGAGQGNSIPESLVMGAEQIPMGMGSPIAFQAVGRVGRAAYDRLRGFGLDDATLKPAPLDGLPHFESPSADGAPPSGGTPAAGADAEARVATGGTPEVSSPVMMPAIRANDAPLSTMSSAQIAERLDRTDPALENLDPADRTLRQRDEVAALAGEMGTDPAGLAKARGGRLPTLPEAVNARALLAEANEDVAEHAREVDGPGGSDANRAAFAEALARQQAVRARIMGEPADGTDQALDDLIEARHAPTPGEDYEEVAIAGGGGAARIDAIARELAALRRGGASSAELGRAAARLADPRGWDVARQIGSAVRSALPTRWPARIAANSLSMGVDLASHGVAATIGHVLRAVNLLRGGDGNISRVLFREAGPRLRGWMEGAGDGAQAVRHMLETGEPLDRTARIRARGAAALAGRAGRAADLPEQLARIPDQLAFSMTERAELNGLALRQAHVEGYRGRALGDRAAALERDPTLEMRQAAREQARRVSFQQSFGTLGRWADQMAENVPAWKALAPDPRRPLNILRQLIAHSPASPILRETRLNLAAGGAARDRAIAQMVMGTGLGAGLAELVANGDLTGSAPKGQDQRAGPGAPPPRSVRIGDRYYSYNSLGGVGDSLAFAADMLRDPGGQSNRELQRRSAVVVAHVMGSLRDEHWLSTVSELMEQYERARGEGGQTAPASEPGAGRGPAPAASPSEDAREIARWSFPGGGQTSALRIDQMGPGRGAPPLFGPRRQVTGPPLLPVGSRFAPVPQQATATPRPRLPLNR